MFDEIYTSMIQPRGPSYRQDQWSASTHYNDPIDKSADRFAGNSRIWGDASPEVQSRVIDGLIASSERAGLTAHETAYVLAIARKEAGFNPDAAAGSSTAYGLGQTLNQTGHAYGLDPANRDDLTMQCDVLVAMYQDNAHIAKTRGQGEEYIYKYHHDGPSAESGGLAYSKEGVMPYVASYEEFVIDHQKTHGITPVGPSLVVRTEPAGHHHPASLKQGAHGEAVGTLQKELNQLGYTDVFGQPLAEDKHFGGGTKAAVQAFQHDHGLTPDGKAGTLTLAAIEKQSAGQIPGARRLDDPKHPDAMLYLQVQSAVQRMDAAHGRTSDQRSANLMAALTVAARRDGLTCVDHAAPSDDASKVFVMQGQLGSPFTRFASVPTMDGMNASVAQSSAQWQQLPMHGMQSPQLAPQPEMSQAATVQQQATGARMQR